MKSLISATVFGVLVWGPVATARVTFSGGVSSFPELVASAQTSKSALQSRQSIQESCAKREEPQATLAPVTVSTFVFEDRKKIDGIVIEVKWLSDTPSPSGQQKYQIKYLTVTDPAKLETRVITAHGKPNNVEENLESIRWAGIHGGSFKIPTINQTRISGSLLGTVCRATNSIWDLLSEPPSRMEAAQPSESPSFAGTAE